MSEPKVCIYWAPNAVDGNIVRGLLESQDIAVELRGELLSGAYPGVPRASETRVFVEASQEATARAIILRYEERQSEAPDWLCAHCGERNAPSFETCWQCQSPATTTPSSENP